MYLDVYVKDVWHWTFVVKRSVCSSMFFVRGKPENVGSLVSSLPEPFLFSILRTYVCGLCDFPCICLFTVPPLAQAGATGVWNNKHKGDFMPLQSWKDMFFLSNYSVYFHPRQTLFPSNKARRSYFLKLHTIKRHHYIWVPTGVVWFAYATPLTCFIGIIGGTRCITRKKTNSPVFFKGGQTQWQKINARFPMST